MAEDNSQAIFPYVPFQTFEAFIKHLHETVVTDQIDNSMMPNSFSGNSRTGVTSALKALKLIDANNNTSQKLKNLADAYQSDKWAAKLKEYVLSVYTNIPDDVDLKSVTRKQLEDMFPDVSPQMRDKSIRFFLVAHQEAGVEYSPHLKKRKRYTKKRSEIRTRKCAKPKNENNKPPAAPPKADKTPSDMFDLPIPIAQGSFIRVPRNITVNQVALVTAAVGYLKAMAEQNKESE